MVRQPPTTPRTANVEGRDMPVRIHGRLLTELGVLLGLCLAGAGCQNSLVRNDAPLVPIPSDANAQPSRPWMSFLHGQSQDTPTYTQGQIVSMSRPIPIESDNANPPLASSWNPIQRISDEQSEEPTATQVQSLASTQGVLNAEVVQTVEPPTQLNPPTPLVPQPVIVEGPHSPFRGAPIVGPAPREFDKHSYPLYIIEPPDILLIQTTKGLLDQPAVRIQTPVGMDGTINLGIYGLVYVAGMTVEQAREAVAAQMSKRVKDFDTKSVSLEVAAYNSKVYYVIADGGGYGQQVTRFPATGNETVIDALAQIGGLPAVSSKKHIWLARATPGHSQPQIMPVNWIAISQRGEAATNYQIFPGDRLYVSSDPWVRTDTWIARRLAPIQNILGTVLLGSTTVNSVQGKTSSVP
jgi:protein involved in polysaccharide export with SLBB domain